MKSFLGYISEEVLPTAQVVDGTLDIEKPAVRAAINAALAGVTSQPAVTPYVVYNRISKLLAQYHIVLPRKFLEGDKGVEVFEVRQFGHRMGMTNSGEFVHEVPTTHYLFVQYGILSPMGITYAKPIVGGMYRVTARLVDKAELDKLLDVAEITMSEEAEVRQNAAKAMAPKEDSHTALGDCDCSQGDSPSTKKAVKVSMKKIDEGRGMPASVIRHKQKLAGMTPEEKKKHFAGKSEEELKSMARRHGYGKDSDEYSKHVKEDKDPCWKGYEMVGMKKKGGRKVPNCVPVKEEEQIDEKAPPGAKFERMVKHIKKGYSKDGLTKKEKGIAYATAWKAKNKESLDEDITGIKRSSRGRVFKQRLDTVVKKGLGKEGDTQTVVVTKKGDPKQIPKRISKDRYDPSKYNMVRE